LCYNESADRLVAHARAVQAHGCAGQEKEERLPC
jgi:hypothetical protein